VFISDSNRDEPVAGAVRAGGRPIETHAPQGFELDLPH